MRALLVGVAAGLVAVQAARGAEPDAERVRKGLVGTWVCVSPKSPEPLKHIKHITPTHYTWVTYDARRMAVLAASGGTWTLVGNTYTERCDFVTENYLHLRGVKTSFALKFEGDKLSVKGTLDTGAVIDEVWERVKRGR